MGVMMSEQDVLLETDLTTMTSEQQQRVRAQRRQVGLGHNHQPREWTCTGYTAIYCPVHFDCLCAGKRAKDCPLHGDNTNHPNGTVLR